MFFSIRISAQNHSLSGSVKDASNGETIIGATVFLPELNKSVSTNAYGFFSLSAPSGKYTLICSYTGYKTITQQVDLSTDMSLNISFTPAETNLEEVEISTKGSNENVKSTQMGVVQLDMAEIKKIPAFMGEVDILKPFSFYQVLKMPVMAIPDFTCAAAVLIKILFY